MSWPSFSGVVYEVWWPWPLTFWHWNNVPSFTCYEEPVGRVWIQFAFLSELEGLWWKSISQLCGANDCSALDCLFLILLHVHNMFKGVVTTARHEQLNMTVMLVQSCVVAEPICICVFHLALLLATILAKGSKVQHSFKLFIQWYVAVGRHDQSGVTRSLTSNVNQRYFIWPSLKLGTGRKEIFL